MVLVLARGLGGCFLGDKGKGGWGMGFLGLLGGVFHRNYRTRWLFTIGR